MTAKQAAAAARAKKLEAEQNERVAATYREFYCACGGYYPTGIYYGLPEAERGEWKDKARAAAVTLGLRSANTEPAKG